MKKKLTVVLAGVMLMLMFVCTPAFATWQGDLFVEGDDTLVYVEKFEGKAFFPKAWILRSGSRYWDDTAKQWEARPVVNFGVVQGIEYQIPLNNSSVMCPNDYQYKEYCVSWSMFMKKFGKRMSSRQANKILIGNVKKGEKKLKKIKKKVDKNKKGEGDRALSIVLHEGTTDLDANCDGNISVCNDDGDCDSDFGETVYNCPGDCTEPVCNYDGDCDFGENEYNCPSDCFDEPDPEECSLISISGSNVVQLFEGRHINGQEDMDSPWVNQYPNSANQVTLNCDYVGKTLEFSVCTESECDAPCPDSPYYYEQFPGDPSSYHYRYTCR